MSTDYTQPSCFRIMYPAGLKGYSRARNGSVITTGLEIEVYEKAVCISPITSKGFVAVGCSISVPADRAALFALADQLRGIAMNI